ncbi:hypothetical protein EIP91_006423 [Steccherinum ochraceum]|uniref:Uncharacterized protein n=1 Tax=Steccherinum ochraceum TaxID=92696 RepID=A0A4R0RE39_9APHY|nr:hypothetical protein EIP91_006423 [Steccherinum ochraceum]
MAPPPIHLFMTTIASQPALRQRQETLLRVLQVKKIPFVSYDLASDEEAKGLWRRTAPKDKQQLPGILVGGDFVGTYAEFEDAVEYGELDIFLRLKENFTPSEYDRPAPEAKPVGVPGAYSPNEMNPKHRPSLSPSPSASPLKGKGNGSKTTNELAEYGIHDVELTEDDLTALVEELGLGEADASDLVKGLSGFDSKSTPSIKVENVDKKKVDEKIDEKVGEKKVDEEKVDEKKVDEKLEKVGEQKAEEKVEEVESEKVADTASPAPAPVSETKDNAEVNSVKTEDAAEIKENQVKTTE